jgi:uncharacterized protein (UPF0332 family)
MRRDLVMAEWQLAGQSMRAAELLTAEDFPHDALSRSYYAVLHAAKAVLYVHDVAVDSHRGVRRMFGLHLISSGEIEKTWSAYLGEGLEERLAADYDVKATFTLGDARQACRATRRFLRRIRAYLLTKGFTNSQLRRKKRD